MIEEKGRVDKSSNKPDIISDVETAKKMIADGFELVEDGTALEHKEGGYSKISKRVQNALSKSLKETDDFEPHMMYDPKTGKEYEANTYEDHMRMKKLGYTHEKNFKEYSKY